MASAPLMTSLLTTALGQTRIAPATAPPAVAEPSLTTTSVAASTVKRRITYNGMQLRKLELFFDTKQFLNKEEVWFVAEDVGITVQQVQVWYQNRRKKWRMVTGISEAEVIAIRKEQKKSTPILRPQLPKLKRYIRVLTKKGVIFQSVHRTYNGPSYIWLDQ